MLKPLLLQPQQIPVSSKPPKAPKIALTLCSFDVEENHVELELSQTRIGKIIKFQFGIMDNEAEEIADRLVSTDHAQQLSFIEWLYLVNE